MDFAEVEAEFGRLKAQFESGALTEEEFKAQLEELMIEDEQGRWWTLGYETGRWYVHDGEKWVQQELPRAAPGAPPAQPQHPGAAGLAPGAQSSPAAAALSRLAQRLKLGRDGVSVLLITAGWLVCFGGIGWRLGDGRPVVPLFVYPITGAIGGLITGLVLRRTPPPRPRKQIPVVTISWGIGWAIAGAIGTVRVLEETIGVAEILRDPGWWPNLWNISIWRYYTMPGTVDGAVAGLVGGLTTALALKWTHPSIQWKHVALVTLGWAIGWAVGGAIGWSLAISILLRYALWAGIGGAVGSWVMFWQLREATQSSP